MGAHSKVGASSADRWLTCPGSVRLSKDLPNYTTEYAAEGTAAHTMAEQCFTSGMSPQTFLGRVILVEDEAAKRTFEITVDQEMVDGVQVFLDAIAGYVEQYGGQARVEVRFHLSSVHEDLFGTGDFTLAAPEKKVLVVLDFKYGAGIPVEVKNNSQLKYYALGGLLELKVGVDKVVFGVVQPRCPHPDGPVRTDTIDAMELLEFADELVQGVKRTEDPFAQLIAGDHCRFCPAAAICPELKRRTDEFAAKAFTPAGPGYDKARLLKDLADVDLIEARCKSVREFAYNEAERGEELTGWKLVAKRATRKFTDIPGVRTWLLARGIDRKDIETEPELKSPAQVEKVLKPIIAETAKKTGTKAAAKEVTDAVWKEFKGFVKAESSGHALVTVDDKRPAVKPAATEVFQKQPS